MLLDIVLAQWRHPVASSEVLNLLHWAICAASCRRTATTIEMARKVGVFFIVVLFAVALAAAGAIQSM